MTGKKQEKWKTQAYEGDPHRRVVDQDGMQVADCYAYSHEPVTLPTPAQYQALAKRIALLPRLERILIRVAEQWGTLTPAEEKVVGRMMDLREACWPDE